MSRFVKEEDLDSFLDDYLKGIILPKIIGLSGPLGAGKTTVAKKIIKFFGGNEVVTSPTFNIVKSYEVGEIKIFHVDLYSLCTASSQTRKRKKKNRNEKKQCRKIRSCLNLHVNADV